MLARAQGRALEGLKLHHPLLPREVPVILGEHVTLDAGTGAVHTAPGHGQEDFAVGQRYGLEVLNPVGNDGRFLPDTPLVAGLQVDEANPVLIQALRAAGAAAARGAAAAQLPGTAGATRRPVIFRATPQWFISMERAQLREHTLRDIKGVQWTPAWGEQRITGMIETRPDWCISRQRTWGVPIPLFVHKESGELHPRTPELIEAAAARVEVGGIDAWFALEARELLGDEAAHYDKVTDVMDVWADSGLSFECVGRERPEIAAPVELYLEGSDQHRGWFHSSLLMSEALYERAPYQGVLTHGFTVDEKGRKMSKSLGNVIAPQKVMNSLGADVLRLWVVGDRLRQRDRGLGRDPQAHGGLLPAHAQHAALPARQPARLRSAHRCAAAAGARGARSLGARAHPHPAGGDRRGLPPLRLPPHLPEGAQLLQRGPRRPVPGCRQGPHVHHARCAALPRRSAQTVMFHIAESMVRWLAPILSFTAEEVWRYLPGGRPESVFHATWHELPAVPADRIDWQALIGLRADVTRELEKLRDTGAIGAPLDARVEVYCAPAEHAALCRAWLGAAFPPHHLARRRARR